MMKLLADYLNEVAYPAELAGLAYSISNHLAGFQVGMEVATSDVIKAAGQCQPK